MTGLIGLMAMAVWFPTTALDGGDGTTAKITEFEDLLQDAGPLLFEGGEDVGQGAPPIRTYTYVRILAPKKENRRDLPCVSRTRFLSFS